MSFEYWKCLIKGEIARIIGNNVADCYAAMIDHMVPLTATEIPSTNHYEPGKGQTETRVVDVAEKLHNSISSKRVSSESVFTEWDFRAASIEMKDWEKKSVSRAAENSKSWYFYTDGSCTPAGKGGFGSRAIAGWAWAKFQGMVTEACFKKEDYGQVLVGFDSTIYGWAESDGCVWAPKCTNNMAELAAMLRCLSEIKISSAELGQMPIILRYDSQVVRGWVLGEMSVDNPLFFSMVALAMSQLNIINMERRSYAAVTLGREPMDRLEANAVVFQWVKGHSNEFGNERVDGLAKDGAQGFTPASPNPSRNTSSNPNFEEDSGLSIQDQCSMQEAYR